MSEDAVHERINKLDRRLTAVETIQPMLQELMERNVASNEKLGETLHEMQTSMALMNQKMDEQTNAFTELKEDMEQTTKKTNEKIESVHKEVAEIKDKGTFDIYGYVKAKFPWIIILLGAGVFVLSEYFKI